MPEHRPDTTNYADNPAFGNVSVELRDIRANSDEQVTAQTIRVMCELARADATSPEVRQAVTEATAYLPASASDRDRLAACFRFVKQHVAYIGDEQLIEPFDFYWSPDELLIRPAELLTMPRPLDDCDGFSMLLAAMAICLGFTRVAFKTVAADSSKPRIYSHVYALAISKEGEQLPLDGSHAPAPFVEVSPVYKKHVWPIKAGARMPQIYKPLSPHAKTHLAVLAGLGDMPSFGEDAPWWQTAIDIGAKIAKPILVNRYGVPPAGTQIIRDDKGNERIATYPGAGLSSSITGGDNSLLIVGGLGLVALLVLMQARR